MIAQGEPRSLPANSQTWKASVRSRDFNAAALDPGNEAAGLSVANVNVADTDGIQKPLNASFDLRLRRALSGNDPAVLTVSFQGQGKGTQLLRERLGIRKSSARFGMNEDRARRRVFIETGKWIVGEQNAVFFTDAELLQTCAAWTATGGTFHMGRVSVLGRLQSAADFFSKCGVDR